MLPQNAKVLKVENANINGTIKTITLDAEIAAVPGQFLMVWIPGVDEIPLAVSNNKPLELTVSNVGDGSGALHRVKPGENVWFRGPFGNGFEIRKGVKRILLVGGGYGIAPMKFLAKYAKENKIAATFIIAARTKKILPCGPTGCKLVQMTDDGTAGKKGYATDAVEAILAKEKFGAVYTCGPERMMRAVAQLASEKKTWGQLSLERYMKCGIGVCGSCAIGDRLVCKDGPVFDFSVLSNPDFGKCKRNACGAKELL